MPVRFALDATAGNGFDTLFLAELVGPDGTVIAIDLQPNAIACAQQKLTQHGFESRVRWCCRCHSEIGSILQQNAAPNLNVAMFNLGYLPLGDKSIITTKATTLRALDQTWEHLVSNGLLSLLSYPGHAGGSEEHQAVCQWVETISRESKTTRFTDEQNPKSPVMWLIVKN
ncbi:MAG: methyltransferase domain-containing protein [Pirellula sp.]|nr:methyltransferase domain-containing protein [Pirellula sp.]